MDGKPRLLLVDSDRDFIDATRFAIEEYGFEVLTCHTACEALGVIGYECPDIIVSEVMLEKHDSGFELAKKVKADSKTRDIPIILLTALREKTGYRFDIAKDGYWMKADDYFEKPLPLEKLVSSINRLLKIEDRVSAF